VVDGREGYRGGSLFGGREPGLNDKLEIESWLVDKKGSISAELELRREEEEEDV